MIKDDLLRVLLEFHSDGIINQSINATFIALVPKKKLDNQNFKFQTY